MAIFNSYVSLPEGTVYNGIVIYQPDNGDLVEVYHLIILWCLMKF